MAAGTPALPFPLLSFPAPSVQRGRTLSGESLGLADDRGEALPPFFFGVCAEDLLLEPGRLGLGDTPAAVIGPAPAAATVDVQLKVLFGRGGDGLLSEVSAASHAFAAADTAAIAAAATVVVEPAPLSGTNSTVLLGAAVLLQLLVVTAATATAPAAFSSERCS